MDSERIQICLDMLQQARQLPVDDAQRRSLERAAGDLLRDGRLRRRAEARAARAAADAELLATTAMGARDRVMDAALPAPAPPGRGPTVPEDVPLRPGPSAQRRLPDGDGPERLLNRPLRCYVCKNHYLHVHDFYHLLCPECAGENFAHRTNRTDLTGRRALLTGGRVKIGFQVALMLLRDGAELTVTSRFPQDTVRRFASVPDASQWWSRLRIAVLDLRDPRQVLAFTDHVLAQGLPLDILINNAAQTLRRSPQAYAALAGGETTPARASLGAPRIWTAPEFSVPGPRTAPLPWTAELAPRVPAPRAPADTVRTADAPPAVPLSREGVDEAGLLPETTATNSWTLRLGQIDPAELLEVQLVNAVAPFLLADRLLPLLDSSPHPNRYLINVSAVEGRFTVHRKTGDHPHTNMAKAALNMLTRTSAAELATRGIHTCSVDTGWVTDEKPLPARSRHAATGWRPPLDVVDGAARVYHPIVRGQAGAPVHGILLKDYRQVPW
ncbi:SDR family NAD(P)-dependent oxidoreductase [Streptomyces sp. NPDC001568]|uniref:SDR family NAD(P)-dependent oxidoreductase n=1 Tax=Streptomyces sp. NPDC001568 TaxID=3364588 RepID=UPI0036AFC1AE